jgi:hypothetical protein
MRLLVMSRIAREHCAALVDYLLCRNIYLHCNPFNAIGLATWEQSSRGTGSFRRLEW